MKWVEMVGVVMAEDCVGGMVVEMAIRNGGIGLVWWGLSWEVVWSAGGLRWISSVRVFSMLVKHLERDPVW